MLSKLQRDRSRRTPEGDGVEEKEEVGPCQNEALALTDDRNPLLSDLVLKRLFELCPLESLREFRLVSKQWYTVSLPIWRSEMTLRICQSMFPVGVNVRDCKPSVDWHKQIEELEMGSHPFKKYQFLDFKFNKIPSSSTTRQRPKTRRDKLAEKKLKEFEEQNKVWEKCGPFIRKLLLKPANVYHEESLKKVIFEQTPNLEELTLDIMLGEKWGPAVKMLPVTDAELNAVKVQPNLTSLAVSVLGDFFPISWRILFAHFPNLQKIDLHLFSADIFLPFVEDLEAVDQDQKQKIEIKDFSFDCRFYEDDEDECIPAAERLLRLPLLNLESLCLRDSHYKHERDEPSVAVVALQIQCRTLKKLCMKVGSTQSQYSHVEPYDDFPFPGTTFDALAELTLFGGVARNLHFLEHFPNLKVLRVFQGDRESMFEGTDPRKMESFVLPHLQKLVFVVVRGSRFHVPEERIKMLAKVMPNVTHLTAPLLPPALRVVCRNWKHLVKLTIVAGLKKTEDSKEAKRPFYEGFRLWTRDKEFDYVEGQFCNIRSLNDLEQLNDGSTEDDSESSWSGFEELPKLRILKVIPFAQVQMTNSDEDSKFD